MRFLFAPAMGAGEVMVGDGGRALVDTGRAASCWMGVASGGAAVCGWGGDTEGCETEGCCRIDWSV